MLEYLGEGGWSTWERLVRVRVHVRVQARVTVLSHIRVEIRVMGVKGVFIYLI